MLDHFVYTSSRIDADAVINRDVPAYAPMIGVSARQIAVILKNGEPAFSRRNKVEWMADATMHPDFDPDTQAYLAAMIAATG